MRTYLGNIGAGIGPVVTIIEREIGREDQRPLPLRLDLINHSPTGFAWGYHGSGPAQLALAILADALNDDAAAVRLHQIYKAAVISQLRTGVPWSLTQSDVMRVARNIEAAVAAAAERIERIEPAILASSVPLPWRLDAHGFLVDREGRSIAGALIRHPELREHVQRAVAHYGRMMTFLPLALGALALGADLAAEKLGANHSRALGVRAAFEYAGRIYVEAGGDPAEVKP